MERLGKSCSGEILFSRPPLPVREQALGANVVILARRVSSAATCAALGVLLASGLEAICDLDPAVGGLGDGARGNTLDLGGALSNRRPLDGPTFL